MTDLSNYPTSGKWTWNDKEKGLEFSSNNQTATTNRQVKKKKEKVDNRSAKRVTPKSPTRQGIKPTRDHMTVTLEDIKDVAKYRMSEVEFVSPAFEKIFNTSQLDEFLLLLLNYFHWFFEKRTYELSPNPMHIEQSNTEKKFYLDMCARLEAAQKHVGRAYGVIILGLGMCGEHHMNCGERRVSNTTQDRNLFETFYSFCAFFVWIAYKRREYEIVKQEVNRMLRTDTFNPMLRAKIPSSPEPIDEDGESKEKKLSASEYRKSLGTRPPVMTVVHQRSNAVVSFLPTPKEDASWLFTHTRISTNKCRYISQAEPAVLTEEEIAEQAELQKLHKSRLKLGIIGDPLHQFDPVNLSPLDEEEQEEVNKLKLLQPHSEHELTPSEHEVQQ